MAINIIMMKQELLMFCISPAFVVHIKFQHDYVISIESGIQALSLENWYSPLFKLFVILSRY